MKYLRRLVFLFANPMALERQHITRFYCQPFRLFPFFLGCGLDGVETTEDGIVPSVSSEALEEESTDSDVKVGVLDEGVKDLKNEFLSHRSHPSHPSDRQKQFGNTRSG